ncbi:MAG: hypothetical protein L6R39_003395 [Caloplaca ligustica]|nr:MAG: hypothetical protein L6R39_003395 [Caloplaca ligustica]
MVDYYEGLTYAEIDLDTDPCIFPLCGHVITRENLDQHMSMKDHYDYTTDSSGRKTISAPRWNPEPFSITVQKTCPACRLPLRSIHRYGRIERRAWIDEATKKFIVWANAKFVPLTARMGHVEEQFNAQDAEAPVNQEIMQRLKALELATLTLAGPSDNQMQKISNLTKKDVRFQDALQLRKQIKLFLHQVDEKEQPFSRIHDLVQDAKSQRGVEDTMLWTPEVLQTRNRILATVLLLRCEYAIMANFLVAKKGTGAAIKVDVQIFQDECERLIEESKSKKQPASEVEGRLFWARFMAIKRGISDGISDASPLLLVARHHLRLARDICISHPGQTNGMLTEVEDAEKMLRDSIFYTPVTNEEKAAVYAAIASDFRGTGHWYYCENGHPFTVGECGLPMQTSRCPQCGAPVGGQSHQVHEGVTRAADMDAQFGRLAV